MLWTFFAPGSTDPQIIPDLIPVFCKSSPFVSIEISAKMFDTPIPDYLIEMLKESGEIDENSKPLNDVYDPDDDDQFGTKRTREHNTEQKVS